MPMTSDRKRRELARAMRDHPAGRGLRGGHPSAGVSTRVARGDAASPGVRLTARGRRLASFLAAVVAVGVAVVAATLLGGAGAGAGGHLELVGESSVVVRSGDTLWSIAASVAGDDDVRDVVHRIEQVNHLHGPGIAPGQVLLLP